MVALALAGHGGVALGATSRPAVGDPWRVVSATHSKAEEVHWATIRFANGRKLAPRLYAATVIGKLPTGAGTPYLVLDGVECAECDATARSVYVGDPTAWPEDFSKDGWVIGYPSRNYSATTGRLMSWSRLFIGRCLGERPAVVAFYASRQERGWSQRVDWVEVINDRLAPQASEMSPGTPRVSTVLKFVRTGKCREVQPQTTNEGDFG